MPGFVGAPQEVVVGGSGSGVVLSSRGRSRGVEPQQRQAAGRLARLPSVPVRRVVLSPRPRPRHSASRRYAGRGPAAGKKGGGKTELVGIF